MKYCPFCEEELEIVDIDEESFDVLGCVDCDWNELDRNNDEDMKYYI